MSGQRLTQVIIGNCVTIITLALSVAGAAGSPTHPPARVLPDPRFDIGAAPTIGVGRLLSLPAPRVFASDADFPAASALDRLLAQSEGGDSKRDDSGSSSRSDSGSKDAKKKVRPKVIVNRKLPDKYRSKDKDGDNQIGVYEWPREDLAGFRKLDHNGDGFLTASELLAKPRSDSGTATASGSRSSRGKSSSSTSSSTSTSSNSSSNSSASTSSGSESKDPGERAFDSLDRDKNGTVTEAEWRRSLSTRPKFEKMGIAVEFPLSRTTFLQLYPQAYPGNE